MTLALCLLAVAFGLAVAEVAIPSFGLLSLLSAGAYTWALIEAFNQGQTEGWSLVGAGILLLPIAFAVGLHVLPRTPIGRLVVLRKPTADEIAHGSRPGDTTRFVGQVGSAITDLRPTGIARIGDERIDVVSGGTFILKGTPLIVSDVKGNRIVVQVHQEP